jgi:hypothetical protein
MKLKTLLSAFFLLYAVCSCTTKPSEKLPDEMFEDF